MKEVQCASPPASSSFLFARCIPVSAISISLPCGPFFISKIPLETRTGILKERALPSWSINEMPLPALTQMPPSSTS